MMMTVVRKMVGHSIVKDTTWQNISISVTSMVDADECVKHALSKVEVPPSAYLFRRFIVFAYMQEVDQIRLCRGNNRMWR